MRHPRVGPALLAAALLAALAGHLVPRALEAHSLLAIADDPVRIAKHALDEKFNAGLARQEIEAALAANAADLAASFVALAAERHLPLNPALTEKVQVAAAETASARHSAENFARGLVTGEPNDMAGLAGTTLGDLFAFGDLRDVVREGTRLARGEPADELVLSLACVGLAMTAGTYATLGATAPARVGLSVAKAARKTGMLGAELAGKMGRMLRQAVEWERMKKAIVGASISQPAPAVRATREAVQIERAGRLVQLARDVGTVQAKAGTQAALDGLKIAESPREMARVAKLAAKEGSKTRAILKVIGRGAIALTAAGVDLGLWVLGALFAAFAFVSSLKSTAERIALRVLRYRKQRRRRRLAV